jgi:hypothetical protein
MAGRSRALAAVVGALDAAGIDHALIGAFAVGLYGAPRNTGDLDLLAWDQRLFEQATWEPLSRARLVVDIRVGDDEDELVGVVRIAPGAALPIDVVMPRGDWVRQVLDRARARARRVAISGTSVLVVDLPDLVLTKLYAGGPLDERDILDVLGCCEELGAVAAAVDARVVELPERCARAWRGLRATLLPG